MREYTKVSPLIWRDKRFLGLASSDARLLYLYYLAGEHQNPSGCFRIPDSYASSDLQWELDRYRAARAEVTESGLVLFDPETAEVYIADWYETNPVTNSKHYMGALRNVVNIDSDMIRQVVEPAIQASEDLRQERERKRTQEQNVSKLQIPGRSQPIGKYG